MQAVDAINARYGRGTVRVASTGVDATWQPRAAPQEPRLHDKAHGGAKGAGMIDGIGLMRPMWIKHNLLTECSQA